MLAALGIGDLRAVGPRTWASSSESRRQRTEAQAWRPQGAAESRRVADERDLWDAGRTDGRRPAHLSTFPVGFAVGEGGLRTQAGGQRDPEREGSDSPAVSRPKGESGMGVGGGLRLPEGSRHPSAPRATPTPRRVCVLPNPPQRAGAPPLAQTSLGVESTPPDPTAHRLLCGPATPPVPAPPRRGARPAFSRETRRGTARRAIPPTGPCRLALCLAAYLSSSLRRTHGRPRPRGDIRSPGSDSGPHLQALAAAGEAPRPATGGGSAERRR